MLIALLTYAKFQIEIGGVTKKVVFVFQAII